MSRFTGEYALARALSLPISKAREVLSSVSKSKHSRQVSFKEMVDVFTALDVPVLLARESIEPDNSGTLSELYEPYLYQFSTPPPIATITFLACIADHWIVVRGGNWVSSFSRRAQFLGHFTLEDFVSHFVFIHNGDYFGGDCCCLREGRPRECQLHPLPDIEQVEKSYLVRSYEPEALAYDVSETIHISKLSMLEISVRLSEEYGVAKTPKDIKSALKSGIISFQLATQIFVICGVMELRFIRPAE